MLATPFYAKYTLAASPQAPSILFGTVFIVAIAAVSFWSRLVRRWGIKRTWLWAIGVMALSAIVLGFLPEAADIGTQVTLLSIGLFALALDALQKE
jgi:Na+/melibiose symporter-like transporter